MRLLVFAVRDLAVIMCDRAEIHIKKQIAQKKNAPILTMWFCVRMHTACISYIYLIIIYIRHQPHSQRSLHLCSCVVMHIFFLMLSRIVT